MSEREELVKLTREQIEDFRRILKAALSAQPQHCCCGEPLTLGVVHRKDEPCFHWQSEQPQQEPVARVKRNSGCGGREFIGESLEFRDLPVGTKLYTAPSSGVREGIALQELQNIVNAKRFDVDKFDDDTDFADWAQSRARHAITRAAEQVNVEGKS